VQIPVACLSVVHKVVLFIALLAWFTWFYFVQINKDDDDDNFSDTGISVSRAVENPTNRKTCIVLHCASDEHANLSNMSKPTGFVQYAL